MVLGVTDAAQYSSKESSSFQDLVKKAREGDHNIPVRLVGDIGMKDPFITLPASDTLAQVVQIMASGVHRVAVTKDSTSSEVIGVLSQRKVVKFFWENIRSFVDLEPIYQKSVNLPALHWTLTRFRSVNWELARQMSFQSMQMPASSPPSKQWSPTASPPSPSSTPKNNSSATSQLSTSNTSPEPPQPTSSAAHAPTSSPS